MRIKREYHHKKLSTRSLTRFVATTTHYHIMLTLNNVNIHKILCDLFLST